MECKIASREELLSCIQPNMRLNKDFFLKIYGYEITWPGFKDVAIKKLKEVGCSLAEVHYENIISEYEGGQYKRVKEATSWYLKKCQDDWEKFTKKYEIKDGEEIRKLEEVELLKRKRELLTKLQK